MSIEKKSLISTLKTTKKANVASGPFSDSVKADRVVSKRLVNQKVVNQKAIMSKRLRSFKSAKPE